MPSGAQLCRVQLDLADQEPRAPQVVDHAIENDRYPLSPRIQTLRRILAKFGPLEPAPTPPPPPSC
jgi:hypothetical protein